jgi:hypothetical protein
MSNSGGHRKSSQRTSFGISRTGDGIFFIEQKTKTNIGKERIIKSSVGKLRLRHRQLEKLSVQARTRISPLLQKCCLCLSANESFSQAEQDFFLLTGMKVGHSTLQRQVYTETEKEHLDFPASPIAINEVCIDGGKVRLRTPTLGEKCEWRDYQAARLSGVYYGATFRGKEELTAWIDSQVLTNPLICLGDGHSGVWNLFSRIATTQQRYEILDWFHLKENLFKVGGSLKRLRQVETFLWEGKVEQAIALFEQECPRRARKFLAYIEKHRHRLVNYELLQTEYHISIGSGAVESAIKQLDRRLKISGSQWNPDSVSSMLRLRCVTRS